MDDDKLDSFVAGYMVILKGEFTMKRFCVTLLLLITLGFSILPVTSLGGDVVEKPNYTTPVKSYDELESRLKALRSKYEGTYWTTDGKACNSTDRSKYYYGWQCKGFASYIFNDLFCKGNIGAYDGNKYYIPSPSGAKEVGRKWNVASTDSATVKELLSKAQIGDYIQVRRRGKDYGHSMIVVGTSGSGITIFDCNSDNQCGVRWYTQDWATFASKNIGMSLYHATSYPDRNMKPSQPTITKTAADSTSAITVQWGKVSDATKYTLNWRQAGSGQDKNDYSKNKKANLTGTSCQVTGLEAGKRYYFYVTAHNDNGDSPKSETAAQYTKMEAPGVKVKSGDVSAMLLSWTKPQGADSYTIFRKKYDGEFKTIKTGVTSTSYTDTGLNAGTKYYYKIEAKCSNDGTTWTCQSEVGGEFTMLRAPGVTASGQTGLKITWETNHGNNTYKFVVQRKLESEGSYTDVTTVTSTTYSDQNLTSGKTYNYKITALTTAGSFCAESLVAKGTVPQSKSYLDVNGYLDGRNDGGLGDYGTVEVIVNGASKASNVNDYYVQWPTGTRYEIKPGTKSGYTYHGVKEGTLTGTIGDTTANVRLNYRRNLDIGTDFYAHIINTSFNRYLTNDDDGNVTSRAGTGADNQVWHFERLNDGSYKIFSAKDYQCLDVENYGTAAGTNVGMCPDYNHTAQQWYIHGREGAYILGSKCTQCVLDVRGGTDAEGANINMWDDNESAAQLFTIEVLKSKMDVNCVVDGAWKGDTSGIATFDVWVNGEQLIDDGTDFWKDITVGSAYHVADVKPSSDYVYLGCNGEASYATTGRSDLSLMLCFATARYLDVNCYVDDQWYADLNDVATFDIAIDVDPTEYDAVIQDETLTAQQDFFRRLPTGTRYRITNIKPNQGYRYLDTIGGALEGTIDAKSDKSGISVMPRFETIRDVTRIEVVTQPAKSTYETGEALDTTGLSIRVYYSNGESETITGGYTVSGFSSDSAGTKTVTVSYEGKSTTFNVTVTARTNTMEITAGSKTAVAGGSVDVPVSVRNNPGISSAAFTIVYDSSAMTLESITKGTVFEKGNFTANAGTAMVQWYYADSDDVRDNGSLFVLHFTVNNTASEGEYQVGVQLKDNKQANLTDKSGTTVGARFVEGKLSVTQGGILGDLTGDGDVAMGDVVKLARAVAGYVTLTEQEMLLGDVTGDGDIAMGDVVKLARFVAGYIDSL